MQSEYYHPRKRGTSDRYENAPSKLLLSVSLCESGGGVNMPLAFCIWGIKFATFYRVCCFYLREATEERKVREKCMTPSDALPRRMRQTPEMHANSMIPHLCSFATRTELEMDEGAGSMCAQWSTFVLLVSSFIFTLHFDESCGTFISPTAYDKSKASVFHMCVKYNLGESSGFKLFSSATRARPFIAIMLHEYQRWRMGEKEMNLVE